MTDCLIRFTTALAVVAVASVAAIISYQHTYQLARTHGESVLTAGLLPFTVDGLTRAASIAVLVRGIGIVVTVGANLAHGLGLGPIAALVSAWPAPALGGPAEPVRPSTAAASWGLTW